MKYILLSALLFFYTISAFSQSNEDTANANGLKWFAYPFAFYSPEASFAFGAGGILYFNLSEINQNPKLSSVTASAFYSVNNQYSVSIKPEMFIGKNEDRIFVNFNYDKTVDKFYGIGGASEEISAPEYIQNNFTINARYQRRIFTNNFKAGLVYEFRAMSVNDLKNNPFLINKSVLGFDGGTTSGIGITANYDTRDNIFYPSKGNFFELTSLYYSGLLGSDYNYSKHSIDIRKFFEIYSGNILALQGFVSGETGAPPFYDLSQLGGDKNMRGYFTGRYRDKYFYNLQTEYRIPKIFLKIGAIFFAGIGDVSGGISDMTLSGLKYNYGFGLRYRFDKIQKLDFRMDIGFGKKTNGIYFNINQAF